MKRARELNKLWTRGKRDRVMRELLAGGKLNTKLLGQMLDAHTATTRGLFELAALALG